MIEQHFKLHCYICVSVTSVTLSDLEASYTQNRVNQIEWGHSENMNPKKDQVTWIQDLGHLYKMETAANVINNQKIVRQTMKLRKDNLKAAFKGISCNLIAKMKRFFPPVNLNWERWRRTTGTGEKQKKKGGTEFRETQLDTSNTGTRNRHSKWTEN